MVKKNILIPLQMIHFTFLQSGRSAEMGRCPGGVQQDMQGLYNKKNQQKKPKQAAQNH